MDLCPVADGGEGTLAVLGDALEGRVEVVRVSDPLGRPVDAPLMFVESARGAPTAVLEAATAIGLPLIAEAERDALAASSAGAGELIAAAARGGAGVIHLAVGGSATTDGGAGAIRAIERAGGLGHARLIVLCDVRTAFEDAARVYAPQKGAAPEDLGRLTQRLHRVARRLATGALGRDPRGLPMTGAAGGLAGGLWARFGAELVPGAAWILDRLDFDRRMRAARAVVVGEGKLDQQSLAGKAISEVATRARQAGVPCHAIVAGNELDAFAARMLDIQGILEARTLRQIAAAARGLAKMI